MGMSCALGNGMPTFRWEMQQASTLRPRSVRDQVTLDLIRKRSRKGFFLIQGGNMTEEQHRALILLWNSVSVMEVHLVACGISDTTISSLLQDGYVHAEPHALFVLYFISEKGRQAVKMTDTELCRGRQNPQEVTRRCE
jgi:hypothetical protein